MKWSTEVKIESNPGYLGYEHSSLSIGSCFADEIGKNLKNAGFDISVNPFGVIFNPVSILQLIQNALDGELRESLFLERDLKHFHYGYHSSVFGSSKEDIKEKIEGIQYNVQRKLLEGDRLFLTLGTAWAWRLSNEQAIVANCHKMPSNLFKKELINLDRLEEFSQKLFSRLFEQNPKLKVMLSVSPIRHTKEGLHENNLSKSVLHLFENNLVNTFEQIEYFPAYELVVDELRDYRFYKEDLVHPTDQAVDYVINQFQKSFFNEQTQQRFSLNAQLRKAEGHLFMNATIDEVSKHEAYIENLKKKLTELDK
jgi:GSCFA family